jgi:pimeloyl-[acyl-carrier protein] synthase
VTGQDGLDLTQLDAKPANLHLVIRSADEVQSPVTLRADRHPGRGPAVRRQLASRSAVLLVRGCGSLPEARRAEDSPQAEGSRQVEADRIQQQLTDYFAELIDQRRARPGDDLVSALIAAHNDQDRLTEEEINSTLRLLFVAGYENPVNMIGHGTLALLGHPDQWAALRHDPALAGGAVEEILRYDAPFQFTRRVTTADLELGGHRIERGRHLILWLAAANRNPEQFPDPDRVDIHRTAGRHLAFGSGIHACFGGPLARLEGEIVFTTLTRRLVEPRLEGDAPRYRADVFRSLAELPITFSGIR